jgi:microcystin-dependent protein
MSDPFLGEVRLLSFNFPPRRWAQCNGQLLPISQNTALFSLLGTTYGGNGSTNFALPDLRGRVPIHRSNTHSLGERAGEQSHSLSLAELPSHTHALVASNAAASQPAPTNAFPATTATNAPAYEAGASLVAMSADSLKSTGGSQPHENMQPFLTINFCIALQGIYPSQN